MGGLRSPGLRGPRTCPAPTLKRGPFVGRSDRRRGTLPLLPESHAAGRRARPRGGGRISPRERFQRRDLTSLQRSRPPSRSGYQCGSAQSLSITHSSLQLPSVSQSVLLTRVLVHTRSLSHSLSSALPLSIRLLALGSFTHCSRTRTRRPTDNARAGCLNNGCGLVESSSPSSSRTQSHAHRRTDGWTEGERRGTEAGRG